MPPGLFQASSMRSVTRLHSLSSSRLLQFQNPQRRHYTILGSGVFKPKQYTKYRITTDFSPTSDHDDLYLSEPSKDDLVKVTKDEPIFLRFLKLVADQESRPEAFKAFAHRCEAGLVVEKDVYVTKAELTGALWENGFTELELNAYQLAFPDDYQFHYPELAVLFELTEEDCYKYCLRKRAAKPDDLVEIKHRPTPSKIASYGTLSVAAWFGLQNNVIGNMWMFVKTWPFFAVFYMLASHFQKSIAGKFHSEAAVESQVSREHRLEGEDQVYLQMKKYANDSLALDYLESFKPSVQKQLREFRKADVLRLKDLIIDGMTKHLVAVQQAEKSIESSLQEVIVRETVSAFRESFHASPDLQTAAFEAALEGLEHVDEASLSDPVGKFFKESFQQLTKPGSDKHAVVERVNSVFEQQEKEFLDQFTVSVAESKKVKELKQSISQDVGMDEKTGAPHFDKLNPQQLKELENLYQHVTSKVGLNYLPHIYGSEQASSTDSTCAPFLAQINQIAQQSNQKVRQLQLQSFMQAFV